MIHIGNLFKITFINDTPTYDIFYVPSSSIGFDVIEKVQKEFNCVIQNVEYTGEFDVHKRTITLYLGFDDVKALNLQMMFFDTNDATIVDAVGPRTLNEYAVIFCSVDGETAIFDLAIDYNSLLQDYVTNKIRGTRDKKFVASEHLVFKKEF